MSETDNGRAECLKEFVPLLNAFENDLRARDNASAAWSRAAVVSYVLDQAKSLATLRAPTLAPVTG